MQKFQKEARVVYPCNYEGRDSFTPRTRCPWDNPPLSPLILRGVKKGRALNKEDNERQTINLLFEEILNGVQYQK
jgi:hypothetical protein